MDTPLPPATNVGEAVAEPRTHGLQSVPRRLIVGFIEGVAIWILGIPLLPTVFLLGPIVMWPTTWLAFWLDKDVLNCNFFCSFTAEGMWMSFVMTSIFITALNLAIGNRDRKFRVAIYILIFLGSWIFAFAFPSPKVESDDSAATHDELPDPRTVAITFDDGSTASLVDGRGTYARDKYNNPTASSIAFFGNTATGDLNGDGFDDVAFIVTKDDGGSGIFYYVAVIPSEKSYWSSAEAFFLGDRIAPQSTEIRDGVLIVNYADRAPGEPFTTQPSVGVSKYLRFVGGVFVEVSPSVAPTKEPTACTADAYQCPDGSWVGRTGPRCQFVCP